MDFDDTPAEAALRAEVYGFLAQHATVKQGQSHAHSMSYDSGSEAEADHVREAKQWQAILFDSGWAGITWPKEHGGRGGTIVEQMVFNQELSKFDTPPGVFAQSIGMAGPTIIKHGTPAQQERFLRPMLRGDDVWCQLFSEPGAGSDLAALTTRAERDGDEYVINGQKVWTSSAHYSDWGILLARTDFDVPKHQGITYFLVDMRSPGIDIRPLRQITGTAHFNEVFLTDLRIPVDQIVGDVNRGWAVTMTTLTSERTLIGSGAADPMPALLRLARRYGVLQDATMRQAIADVHGRHQLIKFLGWRVQSAISRGQSPGPESSVLKLAHTSALTRITDLALQIEGASGMLVPHDDAEGHAAAFSFLSQFASKIGGGTDEVQRNIVGERVLGLPGDVRIDKDVPFRSLAK